MGVNPRTDTFTAIGIGDPAEMFLALVSSIQPKGTPQQQYGSAAPSTIYTSFWILTLTQPSLTMNVSVYSMHQGLGRLQT